MRAIEANTWITLFAGGEAQDLPFSAIGVDSRPVSELRGALRVQDSTIATLSGSTVRPLSPGETKVVVTVGDRSATIRVLVHEMVTGFTSLRADQRLVAVPVRLAQGDTARWVLPVGTYWLKYVPKDAGAAPPTIFADMSCGPGDGLHAYRIPADEFATYCPLSGNSSITLAHGMSGASVIEGTLAVERVVP